MDGQDITRHCAERRLGAADRLELFLQVCAAVDHAHRRLVVHRDLKPSNILVTAGGKVKLLDFGIAAELDINREPTALLNRALTLAYASPEQIEGRSVAVASDVYSLGLVLYELLAGQLPCCRSGEQFYATLHHEPEPPSRRAVLAEVPTREIAGDLDSIVLKAIREEPELRYPSVEQFAADLRRCLEGRPVEARRGSRLYVAGRFLRRNRLNVAAVSAVAMALAATAGVAVWNWRAATHNLAEAQRDYQALRNFAQAVIANTDARSAASPVEEQSRMSGTVARYLDQLSRGRQDDQQLQLEIAAAYERLGAAEGASGGPNQGEPVAALANFQKAYQITLRVWRATGSRNSGVQVLNACGEAALVLADPQPAAAFLRSAIDSTQALLARYPQDGGILNAFSNAYGTRAQRLRAAGDLAGALADFESAVALARRAAGARPVDVGALTLEEAYSAERGVVLRMEGHLEEALTAQDEARRISLRAVQLSPGNHTRRQAAFKLTSRAETLRRMKRYAEAWLDAREAKAELQALAFEDAADDQAKADLSLAYFRLSDIAGSQGRWQDALSGFGEALRLRREQFTRHPRNPVALGNYLAVVVRYADVRLARGAAEAVAQFAEAIALGRRLQHLAPSDVYAAADLARAYAGAAECARRSGRRSDALAEMQQSVALWNEVGKRSPLDVELAEDERETGRALAGLQGVGAVLWR